MTMTLQCALGRGVAAPAKDVAFRRSRSLPRSPMARTPRMMSALRAQAADTQAEVSTAHLEAAREAMAIATMHWCDVRVLIQCTRSMRALRRSFLMPGAVGCGP